MRPEEIERMLSSAPAPPPPERLAERIVDEIPEAVEVGSRARADRTSWRLAAAAVLTVALTGTVAWELRNRRPSQDLLSSAVLQVATPAPQQPTPALVAPVQNPSEPGAPVSPPHAMAATTPIAAAGPTEVASTATGALPDPARPARTGQLVAEVVDDASLPLPGVTVTLDSPQLIGGPQVAMSNEAGKAAFSVLPPGDYRVQATLSGFAGGQAEAQVESGRATEIGLELTGSRFTAEVVVTGAVPERDTNQSNSPVVFEEVVMDTAPHLPLRSAGSIAPVDSNLAEGHGNTYQLDGMTSPTPAPSTGGTTEPNDQPYGDVLFREYGVNPFVDTEDDRLSTFGLEVDTGSYTVVRRYLRDGNLPPREAVRVEELLNSFDYGDQPPRRGDFALRAEAAPSPFGEGPRYAVLRFGVKGRVVDPSQRKPAVLTFVVDVSGSMAQENRLGLVKKALYELLGQLRPDDRVGLVVYGSRGEVLLEPSGDLEAVRAAIGRLSPGGSTNAEEGLVLGYDLARRFRRSDGLNRVILCSDGVANVGRTGPDSILERIRAAAKGEAVELTTVGFGMGNYNDVLMEQLADAGDGRYAYVDSLQEARRLFVEELTGTLQSIARDARVQVDFNPEVVTRYRLIGYENRDIADERFRDNTVDAGEIGAGHAVTALYELKLAERPPRRAPLATLTLRYKVMGDDEWVEQEVSIRAADVARRWENAPKALRLATLVAEYGELLKGSCWAKRGDMAEVLRRAQTLQTDFPGDPRVADFVALVAEASKLKRDPG